MEEKLSKELKKEKEEGCERGERKRRKRTKEVNLKEDARRREEDEVKEES